uniref:Hesp-C63 n=1 Tax=Melampsora lini TaxID=5261 RepID=Q2MV28_MELLI|nr:hesp-C63 [Melampsora lini]
MVHKLKNIVFLTICCLALFASTSLAAFAWGSQIRPSTLGANSYITTEEYHARSYASGFYEALGNQEISYRRAPFVELQADFQVIKFIEGEIPRKLSRKKALEPLREGMDGMDTKFLNSQFYDSDGYHVLEIKGEATNEHLQGQPRMRYVNLEARFKFRQIDGVMKIEMVQMIVGLERESRVTENLFSIFERGGITYH